MEDEHRWTVHTEGRKPHYLNNQKTSLTPLRSIYARSFSLFILSMDALVLGQPSGCCLARTTMFLEADSALRRFVGVRVGFIVGCGRSMGRLFNSLSSRAGLIWTLVAIIHCQTPSKQRKLRSCCPHGPPTIVETHG